MEQTNESNIKTLDENVSPNIKDATTWEIDYGIPNIIIDKLKDSDEIERCTQHKADNELDRTARQVVADTFYSANIGISLYVRNY